MRLKPLRDIDIGERIGQFAVIVRLGPPLFIILVAVQYLLMRKGRIGNSTFVALIALDPLIALAASFLVWNLIGRAAGGFVSVVHAGGNIAPTRQYSEQDALVMQGKIAEAVESFRTLIMVYPEDLDARLRLAHLLARDPATHLAAEQVFLDVRELGPAPQQTAALSNGLIDLYRTMGRRDDLKLELGRFARRFPASREGISAGEYLRRLDVEDGRSSPG